ncbi:Uncharacterized protein FWK35_00037455, partial [Aphis craccivora]
PNIWLNKNICAWPKDSKLVNKSIETRVKPNKKDFTFFSARKLGNKDYDSLSEARRKISKALYKSDLSSAEDERTSKSPKKKQKMNTTLPVAGCSKNSSLITSDFPPRFNSTLTKGNMTTISIDLFILDT